MAKKQENIPNQESGDEKMSADIQTLDEQAVNADALAVKTDALAVNADKQAAAVQPDGEVKKIISKSRANKTIFALSGKPIVFNDKGEALVSIIDFLYLSKIKGFTA